jgi:hypothetical protein
MSALFTRFASKSGVFLTPWQQPRILSESINIAHFNLHNRELLFSARYSLPRVFCINDDDFYLLWRGNHSLFGSNTSQVSNFSNENVPGHFHSLLNNILNHFPSYPAKSKPLYDDAPLQ